MMSKKEARQMQRLTEENRRLREEMEKQAATVRRLVIALTTYRIAVIRIADEVDAVRRDGEVLS